MLVSKIKAIRNGRVIMKDSKTKDRNLTEINQERRNLENAYAQALRDGDKASAKGYSDRLEELRKEAIKAEEKRDEERKNFGDSKTKDEEKYFVRFIWNGEEKGVTLYASQLAQVGGFKSSPEESAKKYMEKLFSPDVKVISVSSLGKDSKTRDWKSVV